MLGKLSTAAASFSQLGAESGANNLRILSADNVHGTESLCSDRYLALYSERLDDAGSKVNRDLMTAPD